MKVENPALQNAIVAPDLDHPEDERLPQARKVRRGVDHDEPGHADGARCGEERVDPAERAAVHIERGDAHEPERSHEDHEEERAREEVRRGGFPFVLTWFGRHCGERLAIIPYIWHPSPQDPHEESDLHPRR